MKSGENFKLLYDLADQLHAAGKVVFFSRMFLFHCKYFFLFHFMYKSLKGANYFAFSDFSVFSLKQSSLVSK